MKKYRTLLLSVFALMAVNWIAHKWHSRFDLTEDQRFTLSKPAIDVTKKFDSAVVIDVLLDGDLPAEFARLRSETAILLEQFQAENNYISFDFVNPIEEPSTRENTVRNLQQLGLKPASITIEEDGRTTQELVFPWAMVNHGNRTVKVPLLKNKLGATPEERINNSVQNLEYAFADAFSKLKISEKKKIAVLKGNGELQDLYIADFLTELREYYNIGAITLDSTNSNPERVLTQLCEFDMALVAKPTQAFSEEEKFVLDQFVMRGGKSLWLVDQVAIELDSLFNEKGTNVAARRYLNLDDFFFRYGVRINPVLINDLYNTPIVLANGEANESQYNPLPWVFHPMVFSKNNHPTNTNIEALRFQFANAIDTLPNLNKKTVLLQSSPLSKIEGVPKQIGFDQIGTSPRKDEYPPNQGYPMAVLVEGEFSSAYKNRLKPFPLKNSMDQSNFNRIIVISDGDIIKNQLQNGRPLELGYDKWTSSFYGNKEFLINCVNYLLDETGFMNIRSKTVSIPILDINKVATNKTKWQLITIALPTIFVLLIGFLMYYLRKKRFAD